MIKLEKQNIYDDHEYKGGSFDNGSWGGGS